MTHQEELEINSKQLEHNRNHLSVLSKELLFTRLAIEKLEQASCNWVFKTHEDAESKIQDYYENTANESCEGSGNRGYNSYEQNYTLEDSDFIYQGVLEVEYNRHDKQYYYIDGTSYEFTQVYPT